MSVLLPTPSAEQPAGSDASVEAVPRRPAGRDASIDLVRAVCLLVVVALHSTMVGVRSAPDGSLLTSVAIAGTAGFVPVSWIIQVMPLFFIAGGFAALSQWRRMRSRGSHWTEFVMSRTRRLVVPTAAMFIVVGAVLVGADGLGADPVLIAEARLRIAQPLWFLAVYLGVTALVPLMTRLHARRPVLTLVTLGAGVLAVDAGRLATGEHFVGFLNLGLVWVLAQQLGFLLHDGAGHTWSRTRSGMGIAGALSVLLVLVTWGPYSPDMLVNLNPPTAAIALLGTAQFFALRLAKPMLDRMTGGVGPGAEADEPAGHAVASRPARSIGAIISAHAMTVYLWHMPVILGLVVFMWLSGFPLPEPHSASWWATRIPWLLAVAVVTSASVMLIGKVPRAWAGVIRRVTTLVELMPGRVSRRVPGRVSRRVPGRVSRRVPGRVSRRVPGRVSGRGLRTSSAVAMAVAGVAIVLVQMLPLLPTTLLSLVLLGGSLTAGRPRGVVQQCRHRGVPADDSVSTSYVRISA